MTATTQEDNTAGGSSPKFSMNFLKSLCEWRVYLGVAIFFVALTLILGIVTLSFLKPQKEPLMFGLMIVSILLSLGTFASLCFFVQRAKDQKYGDHPFDPSLVDVGCALGIATLFGLSALAQIKELPKRCYSGPNEDYIILGPHVCGTMASMGVFSCLGALTMLVTMMMVIVAVKTAVGSPEPETDGPPPVFPGGTEPAVMRWLGSGDRNDPFVSTPRGAVSRQNSVNNV